jgi:hypothetical protein
MFCAGPRRVARRRYHLAWVTMDRYGHLFPSDTEALAEALDGARSQALAVQMRTNHGPDVVELPGS